MILLLILFDGQEISGTRGWLVLVTLYLMFAIFHIHIFPLRVLKMVQKRGEVSYGETVGMGLLLFFWPVGLWMIHPEVKKNLDSQIPPSDLPQQQSFLESGQGIAGMHYLQAERQI